MKTITAYRAIVNKRLDLLTFEQQNKVVLEQIYELAEQLDAIDISEDLTTVSANLREMNQNIGPVIPILQKQVDDLTSRSQTLTTDYPQERTSIQRTMKTTNDSWKKTLSTFSAKEKSLQTTYDQIVFDNCYVDLETWMDTIRDKLKEDIVYQTQAECELAIEIHQDLNIEMLSREDEFSVFQEKGKILIASNKDKAIVKRKITSIVDTRNKIKKSWNSRMKLLENHLSLLQFRNLAVRFEIELSEKKKLCSEAITDLSIDSIQLKINLYTSIHIDTTDLEKMQKLIKDISKETKSREDLNDKLKKLIDEKNLITKQLKQKKDELEMRLEYLQFKQQVNEVMPWMNEQLNSEVDDLHITSIHVEIFDSRVKEFEETVTILIKKGDALTSKKNQSKEEIATLLQELKTSWHKVVEKNKAQKVRMQIKLRVRDFRKSAMNILSWMKQKKSLIENDEFFDDIDDCSELLDRVCLVEKEASLYKEEVVKVEKERLDLVNDFPTCFTSSFFSESKDSDSSSNSDSDGSSGRSDLPSWQRVFVKWSQFEDYIQKNKSLLSEVQAVIEFLKQSEGLK